MKKIYFLLAIWIFFVGTAFLLLVVKSEHIPSWKIVALAIAIIIGLVFCILLLKEAKKNK